MNMRMKVSVSRNFEFLSYISFFQLFISGCVRSSLLGKGFLQLQRARATLHCGARTSYCGGFSGCGAGALGKPASAIAAHRLSSFRLWALGRRLSSCGI